jgi:hypothetical protein
MPSRLELYTVQSTYDRGENGEWIFYSRFSPRHDFESIADHDETLGAIGKLDLETVRILTVIHRDNSCRFAWP